MNNFKPADVYFQGDLLFRHEPISKTTEIVYESPSNSTHYWNKILFLSLTNLRIIF